MQGVRNPRGAEGQRSKIIRCGRASPAFGIGNRRRWCLSGGRDGQNQEALWGSPGLPQAHPGWLRQEGEGIANVWKMSRL